MLSINRMQLNEKTNSHKIFIVQLIWAEIRGHHGGQNIHVTANEVKSRANDRTKSPAQARI